MYFASLGMNWTTASLMRQVLSPESVVNTGSIFSMIAASPICAIRSSIFSIRDTITSVELFFSKIDTIGIRRSAAYCGSSFPAKEETAWAIDPFTCWDDSVVNWSFNDGRAFYTTRLVVHFLARSGSFETASERTSGSASPIKVTYIGKMETSLTCWEVD